MIASGQPRRKEYTRTFRKRKNIGSAVNTIAVGREVTEES